MTESYEGDVTVRDCWSALAADPAAVLVDVRTVAEWTYVGFPQLGAGRSPLFFEWQTYPAMGVDPGFAERLSARILEDGGSKETPIYFLCRSGARSMASAAAMTAAGFRHCYNVLDGFEGPLDAQGHRGHVAGWKAEGLPWAQR